MKASELRIGNLVNVRDEIVPISSLSNLNCSTLIKGCNFAERHFAYDNIKPIQLTEEWLLRIGFVPNPYQDRYENEVMHVECNKTRGITELWIDKMPHIQYVHQLQNLYFALTGEELLAS